MSYFMAIVLLFAVPYLYYSRLVSLVDFEDHTCFTVTSLIKRTWTWIIERRRLASNSVLFTEFDAIL